MQIQKFQRKPFTVEGVKVTEENLEEVAAWCLGEIQEFPKTKKRYIRVDAHRPMNERQTQAVVGDWVLFLNKGFKVYTESAFSRNFELIEAGSHPEDGEFVPDGSVDQPLPIEGFDSVDLVTKDGQVIGQIFTKPNPRMTVVDHGDHQA